MLKQILGLVLSKVGLLNISLKLAEFILRQIDESYEVPYPGYARDISDQIGKIIEDGNVSTNEIADAIKFFRTGREK